MSRRTSAGIQRAWIDRRPHSRQPARKLLGARRGPADQDRDDHRWAAIPRQRPLWSAGHALVGDASVKAIPRQDRWFNQPIRGTRSPCCPRATAGRAAALSRSAMNSRLRIGYAPSRCMERISRSGPHAAECLSFFCGAGGRIWPIVAQGCGYDTSALVESRRFMLRPSVGQPNGTCLER